MFKACFRKFLSMSIHHPNLNNNVLFHFFSDDFTKDETVASGEDASIKADFVMDLKS